MSSSGGGGGDDWREMPKAVPTAGKGGGAGGGGGARPDACNIVEDTTLNSPVAAVIAALKVGDKMQVQVRPPRGLIAVTAGGAIAGSITCASMLQIIACIQNGHLFEAEVVGLHGGACDIRVQPA
jgi:hypothetical protein